MESKTNYAMIGVTVILLTAGLLSSLLWLSVGFDQKNYNTYIVYMNETATGLNDDSPVKFNGVKVGMISSVELNKADPQKVTLLLKIEDDILISTSTHATLINQGITGTTYLGLSAGSAILTPLTKHGTEPYPVIPYTTSFLGALENNINDVAASFKRVFDKENAKNIKKTLANLQEISNVLAKDHKEINQSLHDLPLAIQEIKTSFAQMTKTAQNLSSTSTQFSKTMVAGKNGIDQLTQQTLPTITLLMQRLNVIAANLEQVTNLMRQNPAVIIRGTDPERPGPGE